MIFNKLNNMKQATFTVSLEKAREWYNSSNKELHLIAVNLFTEEELINISYEQIKQENINHLYYSDFVDVLKERVEVIETLCSYFNKGKKVNLNEVGFIININRHKGKMYVVEEFCGYGPTVSYFRNRKDCEKAIEIIKNEHFHLF